jgi:hypothetical protein
MANKIFISYAEADGKDIAAYAYDFYKNKMGFDVFYSAEEISLGKEWLQEIDDRLKNIDVLLLIATREALESQNVAKEVSGAIRLEKTIIPCKHSTVKNWSDLKKLGLNLVQGIEFDTKEEIIRNLGRLEEEITSIPQPDLTTIASQISSSNKPDAFICHASEDKESVADPLFEALRTHGLNIWYDEFSLRIGDSLSGKIDEGLTQSNYAIIIVSKKFFEKNWPQHEYHAIYNKQVNSNKRIILPVWHDVSREEVEKHSVLLADIVAQKTSNGIETVATNLYKVIRQIETIYKFDSDTGLKANVSSLSKSIQERELLIREVEEEFQFLILSKIYLITKGYRMVFVYDDYLSNLLCAGEEEKRRIEKIVQDLMHKNFIASKALGTTSITHEGIKKIENLIGDSSQISASGIVSQLKNSFKVSEKDEIREIQKLRYDILKRASDLTEEKDDVANTFEVAASLGIDIKKDHEKLVRVHFYLQDEGLIEPFAVGGRFHLTAKGRQRVKECSVRIF